ncbi:hypothetical protein C8J57DRAFT_1018428, partial [Mycena rebaudengoi]
AHIEELESQLAYIDAARTELLASLEEHKGILSPIRMLPNEILGEIFFILAKAARRSSVANQAPWLVTKICSRWRSVALSTPALWTMVFLDLDRPGGN